MSTPEPRRDESGVPWCISTCGAFISGDRALAPRNRRITCAIDGAEVDSSMCVCSPAIRADYTELIQLRARGLKNDVV